VNGEASGPGRGLPECPPIEPLWLGRATLRDTDLGGTSTPNDTHTKGLLEDVWPLFADEGARIKATLLLVPLLAHWSDYRAVFYARYEVTRDPRWLNAVLPTLAAHAGDYKEKRLFYEAENAWIRGDREKGGKLLATYMRGREEKPYPIALSHPYRVSSEIGHAFYQKGLDLLNAFETANIVARMSDEERKTLTPEELKQWGLQELIRWGLFPEKAASAKRASAKP
jgi:hypothetical protein